MTEAKKLFRKYMTQEREEYWIQAINISYEETDNMVKDPHFWEGYIGRLTDWTGKKIYEEMGEVDDWKISIVERMQDYGRDLGVAIQLESNKQKHQFQTQNLDLAGRQLFYCSIKAIDRIEEELRLTRVSRDELGIEVDRLRELTLWGYIKKIFGRD